MVTATDFDPSSLELATGHFIGNRTVQEKGPAAEIIRPSDLQVAGWMCDATDDVVDQAVQAASAAFGPGGWGRTGPRQRAAVLQRWADLILADGENLARLESLVSSRPIAETRTRDIQACAGVIRFYAEWADKLDGSVTTTTEDAMSLILREPWGVVAAIVPWNFPLILAAWKFAPALAAGNTVVLKPSELTPYSILRVAQLGAQAGLPPGVFNVVHGRGATGAALVSHPDVNYISFTGSGATGSRIAKSAADGHKEISLELGGKSPQLVFADARNLDRVANLVAQFFCYNAGQLCFAGTRLVVDRRIKDELLDKVVAITRTMRAGKTWESETSLPPVINESQWTRMDGIVKAAIAAGANVITGGEPFRSDSGAYFYQPTVLDGVDTASPAFKEEIFGPVLAVQSFDDEEEALRLADHPTYGLAAGLHTSDLDRALRVAKRLQAGTLWVNCYGRGADMTAPFGGYKQSGNGKDLGRNGFDKYFRTKSVWIQIAPQEAT